MPPSALVPTPTVTSTVTPESYRRLARMPRL
jgi:hypothetical protein